MFRELNPSDWYWIAKDGRVYGSARLGLVDDPATDQAYQSFLSHGGEPRAWPRSDDYQQTDQSISGLMMSYGRPADLVAYAADRRWQKEIGGIEVSGVSIATDDRSKLMIAGARLAAMADPNWSTVWHGADGNTYPINAAAMVAISDAVQAHVNASFATFAEAKAAIESGDISTTAEIEAAFEA